MPASGLQANANAKARPKGGSSAAKPATTKKQKQKQKQKQKEQPATPLLATTTTATATDGAATRIITTNNITSTEENGPSAPALASDEWKEGGREDGKEALLLDEHFEGLEDLDLILNDAVMSELF
jgi:hypothetical protein